jgi:glycerol-3-phosphate O-acyltransferase
VSVPGAHRGARWPKERGPYVALIDASSRIEEKLINDWLDEVCETCPDPVDRFRIPPSRRRRPFATVDTLLTERLSREDDPLLVPIRVAWLAPERDGVRKVRLIDVLKPGDPRDPNPVQQRYILERHPDRCRIVVGESARRSDVEKRWSSPTGRGPADGTSLGEYVAIQAWLALERAERAIRGQRYKVPVFLSEDLFWSRPFQSGVAKLAIDSGKPVKRMEHRTKRYLKEIAAQHSPYVIDVVNGIVSKLITMAHQSVEYSIDDLLNVYTEAGDNPIVFLPSHKSNFDHLVLEHVLYENMLPLNHTAGGINMNFVLVGPLLRRSGIFFIRRSFKDNEPYKFVLRQYLDYLLEKRFTLEWFIEGGRSRSGKLREPQLGMLAYVADAYQREIVDDIALIPVSINYDQITDISSYAAEQRGRSKESESLGWAIKFILGLKHKNGSIHIRFGDAIMMSKHVPRDLDLQSPEGHNVLPKLAFEISNDINAITPITSISLVTLALLSQENHGLTLTEMMRVLEPFVDFVVERGLPTTFDLPFSSSEDVEQSLEALVASGVVHRTDGLTERVYSIGPDERLAAAYYRNTIIHFFVTTGIIELAIGITLIDDLPLTEDAVVERALRLRNFLKFEFFFPSSAEFEEQVRAEIRRYSAPDELTGIIDIDISEMRPAKSPIVLRPFVEAYYVVAETLVVLGGASVTSDELKELSLRMGKQLLAIGAIETSEAVSTTLFASGIKAAASRGLLKATMKERAAYADALKEVLTVLNVIDASEELADAESGLVVTALGTAADQA